MFAQETQRFVAQGGQRETTGTRPSQQLSGRDQRLHLLARPSWADAEPVRDLSIRRARTPLRDVVADKREHEQTSARHVWPQPHRSLGAIVQRRRHDRLFHLPVPDLASGT